MPLTGVIAKIISANRISLMPTSFHLSAVSVAYSYAAIRISQAIGISILKASMPVMVTIHFSR